MDAGTFGDNVRGCSSKLYAAALAITRSDADAQDAVQEAICRGWAKLDTLRKPEYFTTWLTRIAINSAINIVRKGKRSAPLLTDIPSSPSGTDERMDVRRAIESLDEQSRICAVLYYFEDMSIAEVARATGTLEGTVKSRLHRARAKLREVLEGYGDDTAV